MFTFAVAHAGVDLFIVLLSRESFKNMRIHPSKGSKSVSHICILHVDLWVNKSVPFTARGINKSNDLCGVKGHMLGRYVTFSRFHITRVTPYFTR